MVFFSKQLITEDPFRIRGLGGWIPVVFITSP
jgi:hypothetical protein